MDVKDQMFETVSVFMGSDLSARFGSYATVFRLLNLSESIQYIKHYTR